MQTTISDQIKAVQSMRTLLSSPAIDDSNKQARDRALNDACATLAALNIVRSMFQDSTVSVKEQETAAIEFFVTLKNLK